MSLSIGIVGLPNVGKSTLFNALTNAGALAANYPFATIEPNTGIVNVPDERLNVLAKMYDSAKTVPATVKFVDIAGLVAGASQGEGLGNQFLANIRECDAIVHVVRAFSDTNVVQSEGEHSPTKDIEVINTELALADLGTIDKMLPKLTKEAKADPKLKPQVEQLEEIIQKLEAGKPIQAVAKSKEQGTSPASVKQLLSSKAVIYAFNVDEETLGNNTKKAELKQLVAPADCVFVCAKLEEELAGLTPQDAQELLASYGIKHAGLEQLITAAYHTLGLQSYLTAGPKETRAWTVKRGATAPQAAGVIHGDFEKGFIAAQVISYDDLVAAGSEQAARAAGKIRTEGKTYIMQPNDIVEFKFNVTK